MEEINKLNKEFIPEQILTANEMNQISKKIDELIDNVNERNELISKIESEIFPLTIQVSGGGNFEKGVDQTITVKWTIKKGSEITTADLIYVNGEETEGSSKQFFGVTNTTTYTVKAIKDNKTVQGSTTATFIAPMYFGFDSTAVIEDLVIDSLIKQPIKTNPSGTYSLTNDTDGKYLWLCIPNNMTINKVTSNGFSVPMETYQLSSTSIDNYKCYRTSSAINSGEMNITIS